MNLLDCNNMKMKEFVKKQKKKLMNIVPSYFIEGAFEILIAIYLNWKVPINNNEQEYNNNIN